jgi:hypothetical protein
MKYFYLLSFLIGLSTSSYAQHKGTLTLQNVKIGNCLCSSVTVKYDIGHFFGEPTVNGTFKFTGDPNCKLPSSTIILLKIEYPGGGHGYIDIRPSIPNVNGGYGFNTTGSPSWDELICGYKGTTAFDCFDTNTAKRFYKEGSISSFIVKW